jgi:acetoacetyl-CoA reductase
MNDTQDRIALVTGGTRGIGAAISTRLAQHGARVAAVYNRDAEAADAFAKMASDNGLTVSLHQANVGNPGDCQRVVNEVLRHYGGIDYLVNNAGVVHDRTALKMSLLDWEQVIRVDLSGPFYMAKAVLPHFLERGFGRIVNISSIVGQTGRIGQANYSAAKAGLFGLTKTLALETATKGHHRQLRDTRRDQD